MSRTLWKPRQIQGGSNEHREWYLNCHRHLALGIVLVVAGLVAIAPKQGDASEEKVTIIYIYRAPYTTSFLEYSAISLVPPLIILSEPEPEPEPILIETAEEAFTRGYLEAGGNPAWLDHFLYVVLPCEGDGWYDFNGWNGFWTRAQFSDGDTWPKVQVYLRSRGLEPDWNDPYQTGLGTGWWSSITKPWEQWGCW